MYSVQLGFGVPKDLPQGSTQDGAPSSCATCSWDAPTLTLSCRAAIRELRKNPYPSIAAVTPMTAKHSKIAFFLMWDELV